MFNSPVLNSIKEVIEKYGALSLDQVREKIPEHDIKPRQYYYVASKMVGSIKNLTHLATKRQCLQIALSTFGEEPFTIHELTEACWKVSPTKFGFKGRYGIHPDTRKIGFIVFPSRKREKVFEAVGWGKYQISENGWKVLKEDGYRHDGEKLERSVGMILRDTDAYKTYCERGKYAVTNDQLVLFVFMVKNLEKEGSIETELRSDETPEGRTVLQLYLNAKENRKLWD